MCGRYNYDKKPLMIRITMTAESMSMKPAVCGTPETID
jgi:hypothetical protein